MIRIERFTGRVTSRWYAGRALRIAVLVTAAWLAFAVAPARAADGQALSPGQDVPFDPPTGDRSIVPSSVDLTAALQERMWVPLSARDGAFSTADVSPLPEVVNGDFDGSGGWTQLQNDRPINLVAPTTTLGPVGVTTQPNLAWLGGGCAGCNPPTVAALHRVYQTIQLPADYPVSISMDYLVQSLETTCGNDTAGFFVNGAQLKPVINLCDNADSLAGKWLESTVSLARWIGQSVTIEYRVATNDTLNSNLWLDNVQLCGNTLRLPLAQQCPSGPWRETPSGSARANGVSQTSGRALDPVLALTGFNRPYLVWADTSSGKGDIFARRWNGEAWTALSADGSGSGSIGTTAGQSSAPALAADWSADRAGEAWVAWHDLSAGQSEIYVRKWNNSAWVEVGSGSASGGGISNTGSQSFGAAVALGDDGLPFVGWTEDLSGSDYEIYVRHWNGTSWEQVGGSSASDGGISNNPGDSDDLALAWSPNGYIYAAWADRSDGDSEIYVKRWKDGLSAWQEVGSGSASGGGISDNDSTSYAPSIAVAADNAVYLAWTDRDASDTEIYLKRYTDSTGWQELGPHSASDGGISNNEGSSLDPDVAVGPDGRPAVVWSDLSGFNAEIFMRRWNGTAWSPVGAGSGANLGISSTSGFSATPSLAFGPDAVPWVAWSDNSTTNTNPQIYLRRFVP